MLTHATNVQKNASRYQKRIQNVNNGRNNNKKKMLTNAKNEQKR